MMPAYIDYYDEHEETAAERGSALASAHYAGGASSAETFDSVFALLLQTAAL